MKTSKELRTIQRIAQENGVSVAAVRKEIELTINEGMANTDPEIQARWAMIPRTGEKPSAEEFIAYMAEIVKSGAGR